MARGPHLTPSEKAKVCEAVRNGLSITHVANIFKCHRNSIRNWLNESEQGGDFTRKRFPGSGKLPKIDCTAGRKLLKILKHKASKYGFENDFWTTSRIRIVCERELKIKVSRMAIFRTLQKYEHSYKTPQRRYYEADTAEQQRWVAEVVPQINKLVKKHRAILYFEDESNISLSPTLAKTWGPVGKRVVQKVTGNRGSVSAISAISKEGHLIFNVFDAGKRFNADDIIEFLEQMLAYHPRRHLIVVMDRAKCHTAKKVELFIKKQIRLHVFYLPPRSPEYNPDEQVWSHLKGHQLKSHKARSTQELKTLTRSKLRATSKDRNKVRGIFMRNEHAHLFL